MSEAKDLTEIRNQIQQRRSHIFQQQRSWRKITSVCRMRRICLEFHGKSWQRLQDAKRLEGF